MSDDVAEMTATLVWIGETSDWRDTRVALLDAEITRRGRSRPQPLRKARSLEARIVA